MYGSDLFGGIIHGKIVVSKLGTNPVLTIDTPGFSKVELNGQLLAWWQPQAGIQILLDELLDRIETFLMDILDPKDIAESKLAKCPICRSNASKLLDELQENYARYVVRFQRQEM